MTWIVAHPVLFGAGVAIVLVVLALIGIVGFDVWANVRAEREKRER